MKYVKLHEAGSVQYKEDIAKFHQQHPDAQELLAKAKYMFTLPGGVCILTNFGDFLIER